MRFELDKEADALYVYFREIPDGGVARTIELQEGMYLDVDKEGRTLGIEFLDFDGFREFLERNGGKVVIPEHAGDRAEIFRAGRVGPHLAR